MLCVYVNTYLLSVMNAHKYSIENDEEIATVQCTYCEHHIASITPYAFCALNCSVFPCVHVRDQLLQAEQHSSPC